MQPIDPAVWTGLWTIYGAVFGSFLNVVALRHLERQSIVFPGSHCVHCSRSLRAIDLIPVISYLLLRGQCRYCKQPISAVYPAGELAGALLFGLSAWRIGVSWELAPVLLLCAVLHVITHTDLKAMIIPNRIVLPAAGVLLAIRVVWHPLPLWDYVAAALLSFTLLLLLGIASRGGMGGGDMKLYLCIGLTLGLQLTLVSLFAASFLGLLYGLSLRLTGRRQAKQPIPFGPFIAVGSVLICWFGQSWLAGYLSLLAL